MAGRPASNTATPSSLRLEVLKELQAIVEDRDVRDRLDRGPLAETKGREHWVLHLLLRAQESSQAHLDTLIGSAYSNLVARLQSIEDRLEKVETLGRTSEEAADRRLGAFETALAERVGHDVTTGIEGAADRIARDLGENLDTKWKPIGESVETFARSSHQLSKDLSDTYRVSTQSRLLLNENARRIIDLGRDIVALEESLKLALVKVLEDGLQPLEERVAALEGRRGVPTEGDDPPPPDDPAPPG